MSRVEKRPTAAGNLTLISYEYTCVRMRLARIAVVGSVLGSIQHLFYQSLDRRYPARDLRTIALKVAIDQIVCSPVNIAIFIYGLGVMESKTLPEINDEFKEKSAMIYLVSFWWKRKSIQRRRLTVSSFNEIVPLFFNLISTR